MKLVLLFFFIAAVNIFSTTASRPSLTMFSNCACTSSKNGANIDAELKDSQGRIELAEVIMDVNGVNTIMQPIYDAIGTFTQFRDDIVTRYQAPRFPKSANDAFVSTLMNNIALALQALYKKGRAVGNLFDVAPNVDPLSKLEVMIQGIRDNFMTAFLVVPIKSVTPSMCAQNGSTLRAMVNSAFSAIDNLVCSLNTTSRNASLTGPLAALPKYFTLKTKSVIRTVKNDCASQSSRANEKKCVWAAILSQFSDVSLLTNYTINANQPQNTVDNFINAMMARAQSLQSTILAQPWIASLSAYAKCVSTP